MKAYKIISLLCLISLLNGCKKELKDEFDPIIGAWYWHKTNINELSSSGLLQATHTHAWASGSSDKYKIEFEKKGIIKLLKNNVVQKKYRVKEAKAYFQDNLSLNGYSYWTYELSLNKDFEMQVRYYIPGDSLRIGHFPYDNTGYSDLYYTNTFRR